MRLAPIPVVDFFFHILIQHWFCFTAASTTRLHSPLSLALILHSPPTQGKSLFTQSSHLSLGLPLLFRPSALNASAFFINRSLPFFPRVQPTLAGSSPASSWDSQQLPPSAPPFFAYLFFSLQQTNYIDYNFFNPVVYFGGALGHAAFG